MVVGQIGSDHQPEEGDDIVLTCPCSSNGVTEYEFMQGSTSLEKSPSATYTITNAKIGSDDGEYTCVAYIGSETSIPSDDLGISCKFNNLIIFSLHVYYAFVLLFNFRSPLVFRTRLFFMKAIVFFKDSIGPSCFYASEFPCGKDNDLRSSNLYYLSKVRKIIICSF